MRTPLLLRALCGALPSFVVSLSACHPGPASEGDELATKTGIQCAELPPAEPILPENSGEAWQWVEVPGSYCRSQSPSAPGSEGNAGFAIRFGTTRRDHLLIYLQPGGACFSEESCQLSAANIKTARALFDGRSVQMSNFGIFASSDEDNPFHGWTQVFVPYCSGDVFAGTRSEVGAPLSGVSSYLGHRNLQKFLAPLVATFRGAGKNPKVVLAGSSAGGFGTLFNFEQVQAAFCDRPLDLVNDSAPLFPEKSEDEGKTLLPTCLQEHWRALWNLDAILPRSCDECRSEGGLHHLMYDLARRYPQSRFSLVASAGDRVIPAFFSSSVAGCGQGPCGRGVEPAAFATGLRELETRFEERRAESAGWKVWTLGYSAHASLLGKEASERLNDPAVFPLRALRNLTQSKLDGDLARWLAEQIQD